MHRKLIKNMGWAGLAALIGGTVAAAYGVIHPRYLGFILLVELGAIASLYEGDGFERKIKMNTQEKIAENVAGCWKKACENRKNLPLWLQIQGAITLYKIYQQTINDYIQKEKETIPYLKLNYDLFKEGTQQRFKDIEKMLHHSNREDIATLQECLDRHCLTSDKKAFDLPEEIITLLNEYSVIPNALSAFVDYTIPTPLIIPRVSSSSSAQSPVASYSRIKYFA